MYGMQYIQQTIVGIDGSEARFFGYVADNSEEMEPDRIRPAILILPGGGYAMTSDRRSRASGPAIPGQRLRRIRAALFGAAQPLSGGFAGGCRGNGA